jgi:addiction module RelE/StbE family toxin
MRDLIWSNTFLRAMKRQLRKRPEIAEDLKRTLDLLAQDPFLPRLETHKLKGKLSGSWACSVQHDLRVLFDFVKSETEGPDNIFLIDIGTHDEVY